MASLALQIQKLQKSPGSVLILVKHSCMVVVVEVVWFDLNFMFCRPGIQTAHNLALSGKTWHRMICIPGYP